MLVTDLIHWENHQHNEKSHQHNNSATNIRNQSPTSRCHQHHCHRTDWSRTSIKKSRTGPDQPLTRTTKNLETDGLLIPDGTDLMFWNTFYSWTFKFIFICMNHNCLFVYKMYSCCLTPSVHGVWIKWEILFSSCWWRIFWRQFLSLTS